MLKTFLIAALALVIAVVPVRIEWSGYHPAAIVLQAEAGVIAGTRNFILKKSIYFLVGRALKYAGKRAAQVAIVKLKSYLTNPKIYTRAASFITGAAMSYMANHPDTVDKVTDFMVSLGLSSSLEACNEERDAAYKLCEGYIRNGDTRFTGGHTDIHKCAKGLISEACGGNKVD